MQNFHDYFGILLWLEVDVYVNGNFLLHYRVIKEEILWSVNKRLDVKIAIALVKNIKMNETDRAYQEIRQIAKEYQKKYENYQISKIPRINYSRQLFKAIGLDPTKRRPSSESLLRRAIKDKPFYQVNTLVDIGNWCSLEFLLPICVYDADNRQFEYPSI